VLTGAIFEKIRRAVDKEDKEDKEDKGDKEN
jgi:hypothetical protein